MSLVVQAIDVALSGMEPGCDLRILQPDFHSSPETGGDHDAIWGGLKGVF